MSDALTQFRKLIHHLITHEPLDGTEVAQLVTAGVAKPDEFNMTGGGVYSHHSILQPDDEVGVAETVIVIHIAGGVLADVGARRADTPRLRIVVLDDDNYQASDGEEGVWTESPTALEDWSRDDDAVLARVRDGFPERLRRELGLSDPD